MVVDERSIEGDQLYVNEPPPPLAVGVPPIDAPVGLQLGIVILAPALATGLGLTITLVEAVAEQPRESVTVTAYEVFTVGLTVGLAMLAAPLFQAKCKVPLPPLPVGEPPITTLVPLQIINPPCAEALAVGTESTVIICATETEQPFASVTATW